MSQSHWSRRYGHRKGHIQVSEETARYIKHLQFKSQEENYEEEDDITEELLTRIELNGTNVRQPDEGREARKVIENWLQIEDEAYQIRHHKTRSPNSKTPCHIQRPKHCIKMKTNVSINPAITSDLRRQHIVEKRSQREARKKLQEQSQEQLQEQQHEDQDESQTTSEALSASSPTATKEPSSFDLKFAKMKSRAMNRQKSYQSVESDLTKKRESYQSRIISIRQESKLKTKQMVEQVMEFKDEESVDFQTESRSALDSELHSESTTICNSPPTCKIDEITISKQQIRIKEEQLRRRQKRKEETRKVLLFQLQEIEKQERFRNKRITIHIVSLWKDQVSATKQLEQTADAFHQKHLMKKWLMGWQQYLHQSKYVMIDVFREWLKLRLMSQHHEIQAVEFYEEGLRDRTFFGWRDTTKCNIEARKIRAMQLQTRLYKMDKIARRHYRFATFCRIIKEWRRYTEEEQNQRLMEQQRNDRKLKIQKLISNVKRKTTAMAAAQRNEMIETPQIKSRHPSPVPMTPKPMNSINSIPKTKRCRPRSAQPQIAGSKSTKKQRKNPLCSIPNESKNRNKECITTFNESKFKRKSVDVITVNPTEMTSQSIQTETVSNMVPESYNSQSQGIPPYQEPVHSKPIKSPAVPVPSLKPSKMVLKMEKRALERKRKREQLLELKKQKEREYQEEMERQKQMEIERIKEAQRLEKEAKLQRLQQQRKLKEIESNKLLLSQLHYKRALIMYQGWIPWMQCVERRNINYHRIMVMSNHRRQRNVESDFNDMFFLIFQ